jgi:hypothetical protein
VWRDKESGRGGKEGIEGGERGGKEGLGSGKGEIAREREIERER